MQELPCNFESKLSAKEDEEMSQLNGNSWDYIHDAIKTESNDFEAIIKRFSNEETIRLLHGAMGLCTESGEFLDAIKKHLFYGKELDLVNLIEESGDLFWYLAIIHSVMGKAFEYAMKLNIEKLRARYGEKFNKEGAIVRDLGKEREILEQDAEQEAQQALGLEGIGDR